MCAVHHCPFAQPTNALLLFSLQVLASNNLTRLLQRMLAVGNIMNEGTRKGGASGFTLDSLMKMVNTKGTRLLMYTALPW